MVRDFHFVFCLQMHARADQTTDEKFEYRTKRSCIERAIHEFTNLKEEFEQISEAFNQTCQKLKLEQYKKM